jgi:IS6 family transposase
MFKFLSVEMPRSSPFKHHRFPQEIILCAVRWYLRFPLSYQDVVDLLAERGISVDRSTVFRWVQKFGPELTKRTEKYLRRASVDWHVDETYIRIGGKWRYLWRAIDANGQMVDFRLTARRDAKAAKAFLNKAIDRVRLHRPVTIVTDKAPTYRRVIREINHRYAPHFDSIRHIDRKWKNNLIESDHAAQSGLLGCRQSFRSLRSAKATLNGIETIRTIKRGHIHNKQPGILAEIQFITQLFEVA